MKKFGRYDEFELNRLTIKDIEKKINYSKVFYNYFEDKSDLNKWLGRYLLEIINKTLPTLYLLKKMTKFNNWLT